MIVIDVGLKLAKKREEKTKQQQQQQNSDVSKYV